MEMVIDLHAAEVDQHCTLVLRRLESADCILRGLLEVGLALDIQGPGLQRSAAPCLRQPDGIEDALGNTILEGGGRNLAFADPRRRDGIRGRYRQCQRCQ